VKQENSYGIIPLRIDEAGWQVFLIQHQAGHWGFPKGHAVPGEKPRETASRELREETGLTVHRFLLLDPLREKYFFFAQEERVFKTVHYFLAWVEGSVVIQQDEIKAGQWLPLKEVYDHITFPEGKLVSVQVLECLKALDERGFPLLA